MQPQLPTPSNSSVPGPQAAGSFGVQPVDSSVTPSSGQGPAVPSIQHQNMEGWIMEVEAAERATAQTPRKRADIISEVKQRYQEQVLGIQPSKGS